ncbi:hypothetical protein AQUCO_02200117v1 [Aquilegia coerulea]|uniref:CSD domain-containing protein n=1 Tax=Aquilegia coerulea TaxID=218851 RepID=A0A2G5DD70_AQUCA|nr:hypothetical protein AQUCO_02200117v1 [Aquilegia coerulea]
MAPSKEIIYISSDDDDDEEEENLKASKKQKRKRPFSSSVMMMKDDFFILEGDPDKPVQVVKNDTGIGSDELIIVAEKGQIACRDYPHPRHLCASFPFNSSPHQKYCDLCHCYVCDTRAPCVHWGTGISRSDHCHSTDKEKKWIHQRKCFKQQKLGCFPEPKNHKNNFSKAPPQHSAITHSQPLNCDSNTILHQLIVQAKRLIGVVKWFNIHVGMSIALDSGGRELYFHRNSFKSKDLTEGDVIEFQVKYADNGTKEAVDIRCLDRSTVQTTIRRQNGCGYNMGRDGRNCGSGDSSVVASNF